MTDGGLSVAYHEARHAVVALALGLRVARVEIFHEDFSGATDIAPADHLSLVDRIAICVAGMNAGEMFNVPASHQYATSGDHGMVVFVPAQSSLDGVASNSRLPPTRCRVDRPCRRR